MCNPVVYKNKQVYLSMNSAAAKYAARKYLAAATNLAVATNILVKTLQF